MVASKPVLGGDATSFFATEFENPTTNQLAVRQLDPTQPQVNGLTTITNPVLPTQNAQAYVKNFDPKLYDLTDDSHLMRLIRALIGASGLDGLRRQMVISRLTSMLAQGSFLDLDRFYGAIFGLARHTVELMPTNVDGTTVNPYTDVAPSDVWDAALSSDARYRARLFQLAQGINLGPTAIGLKSAAEAVVSTEVDLVESWVRADFYADTASHTGPIVPPTAYTYGTIASNFGTYGAITPDTFAELEGFAFGAGQTAVENRAELIFTPRRPITQEEKYELSRVLDTLRPANTMVTIGTQTNADKKSIIARNLFADSEQWIIENRITQRSTVISADTDPYALSGQYGSAKPLYGDYSGEQWSYVPTVLRTTSYRIIPTDGTIRGDDESLVYSTGIAHIYASADAVKDTRKALAPRLSGEGVVTTMPISPLRAS